VANFGALWIGRPLSKIEVLSLNSYIYHGHNVFLFTYGNVKNIPSGVNVLDAREILPESSIISFENSYSNFSDWFRYEMINKKDIFWTDLDSVCLSSKWDFKDKYVFGINDKHNQKEYICTSSFRLPANSEILDFLINSAKNKDLGTEWAPAGPQLLTEAVFKFNLQNKILPPKAFAPINFKMWKDLWDPEKLLLVEESIQKSYGGLCSKNIRFF